MERKLNELKEIIKEYDNLCNRWNNGENAQNYLELMDTLRNSAENIIDDIPNYI
jgi:hypothetical protein